MGHSLSPPSHFGLATGLNNQDSESTVIDISGLYVLNGEIQEH